jgi:hypothetical protein
MNFCAPNFNDSITCQLPNIQLTPAAHGAYCQPAYTVLAGNAMEMNSAPLPQGHQPLNGVGQGAVWGLNMPNPVSVGNTMPTDVVLSRNYQPPYTVWQGDLVNENNATVTHLSATHTESQIQRDNQGQFRPSVYQYQDDWGSTSPQGFQTSTFKNSHYNVAHYNNPNFQPEQWTPDDNENLRK